MKQIIGMFNKSNNLTSDLLQVQRDNEKFILIQDKSEEPLAGKKDYKSILHLMQDVITR